MKTYDKNYIDWKEGDTLIFEDDHSSDAFTFVSLSDTDSYESSWLRYLRNGKEPLRVNSYLFSVSNGDHIPCWRVREQECIIDDDYAEWKPGDTVIWKNDNNMPWRSLELNQFQGTRPGYICFLAPCECLPAENFLRVRVVSPAEN